MTIGSYNIPCSGCGVNLTQDNIGGYRCYCDTCVAAIPPMPEAPKGSGFILSGTYPNFEWHAATQMVVKPSTLSQWPNFTDEDIPQ